MREKILFLTNLPSPYRVRFFSELGKHCDLLVVYERKNASDRDPKWTSTHKANYREAFLHGINTNADSTFSIDVIKFLRKEFDHIIIGMYGTPTAMLAIQYLRFHHRPFILSTDGGFSKDDQPMVRMIKTHFISSAAAWLSPGEVADQYLLHYGALKSKIFRYPFTSLGSDDLDRQRIGLAEKAELRQKFKLGDNKIILSVGQPIFRKGFDVLLSAFKKLNRNDITLCLVGGSRAAFETVIGQRLPRNVITRNFMSKDTLDDYYRASDLFVLATREDIWGLVINEAMAKGLPVITTDRCGAGLELIDGNGSIAQAGDIESLVRSLKFCLDSSELGKMASRSLDIIKHHTFSDMVNAHLNVFENEQSEIESVTK